MSIVKSALGATAVIGGAGALAVSFTAGSRNAARDLDAGTASAKKVEDGATEAGMAQMGFATMGVVGGLLGVEKGRSALTRGAGVGAFALAGVLLLGTAFSFGRASAAESRM